MDGKLLEILACPICKGPVEYRPDNEWLVCRADRLAYPVRDGIPVMLEDEAQALDMDGNLATAGDLKGDVTEPC